MIGALKVSSDSILALWGRFGSGALGKRIFSRLVGFAIPYTGTIHSTVDVLEKGYAEVVMRDRRGVRNHLRSVHAIALANIGEFSTGLSVTTSMPEGARAILKSIHVEYLKKARGTLRAKARCPVTFPAYGQLVQTSVPVIGEIFDASGECVSRVTAEWVVGPGR
jgi:acyl-coenzyme A thioesterase PaaI-like protein